MHALPCEWEKSVDYKSKWFRHIWDLLSSDTLKMKQYSLTCLLENFLWRAAAWKSSFFFIKSFLVRIDMKSFVSGWFHSHQKPLDGIKTTCQTFVSSETFPSGNTSSTWWHIQSPSTPIYGPAVRDAEFQTTVKLWNKTCPTDKTAESLFVNRGQKSLSPEPLFKPRLLLIKLTFISHGVSLKRDVQICESHRASLTMSPAL